MVELELFPAGEYVANDSHDPARFYRWPLLGRMYRRRVELCLAELRGGERVLEIGFGAGVTFRNLQRLYAEIHGLDLLAPVERVTAMFRRNGIETHLENGSVVDLPYENEYFDAALSISVLEHIPPEEQPRAFSELARVLKAGGQLVYGVPIERPLMVAAFRVLGYNIREHHFSTEMDVRSAARAVLREVRLIRMKSSPGFFGYVYEVGHFAKQ